MSNKDSYFSIAQNTVLSPLPDIETRRDSCPHPRYNEHTKDYFIAMDLRSWCGVVDTEGNRYVQGSIEQLNQKITTDRVYAVGDKISPITYLQTQITYDAMNHEFHVTTEKISNVGTIPIRTQHGLVNIVEDCEVKSNLDCGVPDKTYNC